MLCRLLAMADAATRARRALDLAVSVRVVQCTVCDGRAPSSGPSVPVTTGGVDPLDPCQGSRFWFHGMSGGGSRFRFHSEWLRLHN